MSGPQVQPIPKPGPRPKKRRKPLPFKSEKRAAEQEAREAVVAAALARDGHRCQAVDLVPEVSCDGPLDVHEIIPRSAWPGAHLVLDDTTTLCLAHHSWVDNHPALAHERGLHGYSWERPA